MSVDPQLGALLSQIEGGPSLATLGPEQGREMLRNVFAGIAMNRPLEVGSVEETTVPGGDGERDARIYRPQGEGPWPTLLFVHGGGFTIGDLEGYDWQCRILCEGAGCVVVTSDYRLAPEDPFPAGLDDARAALRWTFDNAAELGGDPRRVAIGGDSAGGNFSAVLAQEFRDSDPGLIAQLLIYPATNMTHTEDDAPASMTENAEGYFLTLEDMVWFQEQYLAADADPADPRLSPALADDLSGLAPAVVATAGYDPLRDDGQAYAEALAAAGNEVRDLRFESMIHGFFALGPISDGAEAASQEMIAAFRGLIHPS
ncbi:alpha/beta hydrolase [Thermoleophilia bacterium SCSIO 60948]|nr:alpha/beta hydrolase [Thermoleophilia bacterium SCSIO 60948]